MGRGLGFLLRAEDAEAEGGSATKIEVALIEANPWQPRVTFDEESLHELAASIKQHGVVQPILVRPVGSTFQLVAGERRLRAARMVGLKKIPAVVQSLQDSDMLTIALVENVQRQDLDPVERARAFLRLKDEQKLSHQQIADASGLGRSTVSNSLRILELDDAILAAIAGRKISEGHARSLLAVAPGPERDALFAELLTGRLSVRETEEKASSDSSPADPASSGGKGRARSAEAEVLGKRLSEHLGTQTVIKERGEKGQIVIRYRSLEEFEKLYQMITGERPDV